MRIPVHAARSLFYLLLNREYPVISRVVEKRLERIDLEKAFLGESIERLDQIESLLVQEDADVKDWPGLSGEFAALATWLLQDVKTSSSSTDFDKAVWSATAERLAKQGLATHYPIELRLQIHHWVVGTSWSEERRESAILFPLKVVGLAKEQAAVAYHGLVEQMQIIESLQLGGEPGPESEMALSSIPIRVLAIAEALNPEIAKNAGKALQMQLTKLGPRSEASSRAEVDRIWNSTTINALVQDRNSIAHVLNTEGRAFTATVGRLDRAQAHDLGVLASTLMAGEILSRMQGVTERSARKWAEQVLWQLENQNLVHLEKDRFL
jgi:hypothetical protein